MKIQFESSGGFAYLPSMSKPFSIDTTQANPETAEQLKTLVQQAAFFDQPAQSSSLSRGAADYMTYTITVEDGPRTHTVIARDPVGDEKLHHLIAYLRNLARPSGQ